jgi:hypothetical protein
MPENRTKKTKATKKAADDASSQSSSSYPGFIPPHGGYEQLLAYKKAEIIYDATVRFCDRFIDNLSRTHGELRNTLGLLANQAGKQFELGRVGQHPAGPPQGRL